MTIDIVELLRTRPTGDPYLHMMAHEAADEIARLRAALAAQVPKWRAVVNAAREAMNGSFDAATGSSPPPAALAVPAGMALVPVEPTEAMHVAAVRTIVRCTGNDDWPPRVWRAMLAASPQAAVAVQDDQPWL